MKGDIIMPDGRLFLGPKFLVGLSIVGDEVALACCPLCEYPLGLLPAVVAMYADFDGFLISARGSSLHRAGGADFGRQERGQSLTRSISASLRSAASVYGTACSRHLPQGQILPNSVCLPGSIGRPARWSTDQGWTRVTSLWSETTSARSGMPITDGPDGVLTDYQKKEAELLTTRAR